MIIAAVIEKKRFFLPELPLVTLWNIEFNSLKSKADSCDVGAVPSVRGGDPGRRALRDCGGLHPQPVHLHLPHENGPLFNKVVT